MALGFGFNKQKVLAAAEKFVQQGKLQNAISEYEKIVKEDPKDLTVLNTLGDLCARVGQNEAAANYFKDVADQYAQDGFTVKAIAVYKKLTRLTPGNFEDLQKLAELYSQQGLLSDARAQYMQVADHLLKKSDNVQAARVLQKILELDPENAATQTKLADLYTKLGKKDEARNIYYSAAESLHARGSYDAAEEALSRVLALDPQNASALLLRGMIAADAGDNLGAIEYLDQVPDLDSRPDALRTLLRAKLQSGKIDGVEALASKLVSVHNDMSGMSALAQWQIANQQIAAALNLFDTYADRFMSADPAGFQEMLHPLIGRIRENPEALGSMLRLLQRTGDSSHSAEIMELQAHACAQKGEYREARDLYQQLSEMEPENPLHGQNHRQMLSKLGEDPTTRALSAEQSSQAFMVEELEQGAAVVPQNYDPSTEKAIEAALTDAELFTSYNVFTKAIPPLEAVLPMAPHDIMLNQRLAALYARGARFADAARRCQVLSEIYRELGHEEDAVRYTEAANTYLLRVPGGTLTPQAPPPPPVSAAMPVQEVETSAPLAAEPEPVANEAEAGAATVQEFSFDVPDHLLTEEAAAPPPPAPVEEAPAAPPQGMHVTPSEPAAVEAAAEIPPPPQPAAAAEPEAASEWESMLSVDTSPAEEAEEMEAVAIRQEPSQPGAAEAATMEAAPVAAVEAEAAGGTPPCYANEARVLEIRNYIAAAKWDEAKKAVLDLAEVAPDAPEVTELIAAVSAGQSKAAAAAEAVSVAPPPPPPPPPPAVEEFVVAAESHPPEPVPMAEPPAPEVAVAPAPVELVVETPPLVAEPAAVAESPAVVAPAAAPPIAVAPPAPKPPAVVAPPAAAVPPPAVAPVPEVLEPPVAIDIPVSIAKHDEAPLQDLLAPEPPAATATPVQQAPAHAAPPPIAAPAPTLPAATASESPLEDILEVAPPTPVKAAPVAPAAAQEVARKKEEKKKEKTTEDILTDFVVDLEKTDLKEFEPRAKPEPVPPSKVKVKEPPAAAAPVHSPSPTPAPAPAPAPVVAASAPLSSPVAQASANGDMRDAESTSVLTDILSELQSELAEETGEPAISDGDPETHYNLGIAFKEMGLLDEAIGELQKVCHAIDAGNAFSQPIQAYTWLAQCLVDKGAPEAAVRWYQTALHLPGLDDGSRCAIYYDLALAFEASGDKKSALANLMEVYGSNIDFRDVASRIKALKS